MIHRTNVPSAQKGHPDCNQPCTPLYRTVRLVNLHTMILSLSLVNARSVVNKVESLQQHILERELDTCAITEMDQIIRWKKYYGDSTSRLFHILTSKAIR